MRIPMTSDCQGKIEIDSTAADATIQIVGRARPQPERVGGHTRVRCAAAMPIRLAQLAVDAII